MWKYFAVLSSFLTVVCCESCDPGWTEYKGSCYQRGDTKLTWHQAELQCMSHGGHLVTGFEPVQEMMKDYGGQVWVMPGSEDKRSDDQHQCFTSPIEMAFEDYNGYDVIGWLLEHPTDADGINTFYFGSDFEDGARRRCEASCEAEPTCDAYTYFYGFDQSYPTWWGACNGRTSDDSVLVQYQHGMSGMRVMANHGSLVSTSCFEEHMYVCEKTARK